ncbi:MAG: hypothetical protein LBQ58_06025 [Synergistaceae bacterium]|jgi:hypothetical protein|nr:hypothetical protein [Synergistaceae bacterium]
MKTIDEIKDALNSISTQLTRLSEDLGRLKTAASATNTAPVDELARIERQATAAPICNKWLKAADALTRQIYMRFLAALTDGDAQKLLFARRIGVGSGSDWNAERLAAERLNINASFMEDAANRLNDLRYSLILDSLVLVHLSGEADEKYIRMIADAVDIFRCADEDVKIVAQLAAAIVQLDKKSFDIIVCEKQFSKLSHLIPAEWLERVYVGGYSSYKHIMAVKTGFVKKGKRIYATKGNRKDISEKTVAPVNGFVSYVPINKNADSPKVYEVYIDSPFYDDISQK